MRFALASELSGSADGSQNSDQSWDKDMAPHLGSPASMIHLTVAYLRFHAGRGKQGRFTAAELRRWAAEVERLAAPGQRTVYVYFINDAYGWAPHNAADLRELLDAG